jgi:hypothetical protein
VNDPLLQAKQAVDAALEATERMRAATESGGTVDPNDIARVLAVLSPLRAEGNVLDRASDALSKCAGALAAAKKDVLSTGVGAVGPDGKPVAPAGYVSSTTAAGLTLGALVVGVAGTFAGFRYFGKDAGGEGPKPKKNPMLAGPPTMKPGYVLKLDAQTRQWQDVTVSDPQKLGARFAAYRDIHGARMALFRSSTGGLYAQLAEIAREPRVSPTLAGARVKRAKEVASERQGTDA